MVSHGDIGLRIRDVKPMTALSGRADIKILALVGNRRGTVYRRLLKLRTQTALAGIELIVGELGGLPTYSEDVESADVLDAVAALRAAAAEADAALILSPVYGSSRGALRNAIDWLTRPCHGELQDKPLAVVVPALGGFVGVWSHPANPDAPHVVERIATADLGELVLKLAAEVARAPMAFEAVHSTADGGEPEETVTHGGVGHLGMV
jgi:NADPH-dependent FMN reductase